LLHIIECFHKTHFSKILCFFQEETHTRSSTEIKKAASSATF
jgi:regulatory function on capsule expression